MLFLPDRLYKLTGQLMTNLEQNINGLIGALRNASALQHGDPNSYAANQEQLLAQINNALSNVVHNYSDTLDELRADYQAISRDLLLGDSRPE
jgi:uncharacterized phage infection (PIP) family protein YhgE